MIKAKTVTLALALTGLTGCEMVDLSNLIGQDHYNFGVGSLPNTQSSISYPLPDSTNVVVKVRMNF